MRSRRVFRIVSTLVVAAFLAVGMNAGASGSEEMAAKAGAPLEIYWFDQFETAWVDSVILEKLNVKIVPNGVYINDSERTNIMLAAGEFPDVGPVPSDQESKALVQDGVTRTIPKAMIKKYAPKYSKMLDKYPLGWIANSNPDNPDEMLALNGFTASSDCNTFLPMFRIDWARNVGIDIPDYDAKKFPIDRFGRCYFLDKDFTIDWYEKLLVAFRDGDPNKSGKKDTIPFGAMGQTRYNRNFRGLMGSWGVQWEENRLVDGKLTYCYIDPGMKDFLLRMAKWYQMGLIDKEFVSLSNTQFYNKVAAGAICSTNEQATYAGMEFAKNRTPNVFVKDEELGKPGAEVCILPPFIGPTGIQGAAAVRPVDPSGTSKWVVNAKVDDAKLARILEVFDYYRGDDEGFVFWNWGKPGVHFDWEGEPWNSAVLERSADKIPAGEPKQGKRDPYPSMATPDRMKYYYPIDLRNFYDKYLLAPRGLAHSLRPYRLDILNETNYGIVRAKYVDNIETIFDEFFYKAVTGVIDINAEWEKYVAMQRKNGMDELLAELQKAPLVSELRKGNIKY